MNPIDSSKRKLHADEIDAKKRHCNRTDKLPPSSSSSTASVATQIFQPTGLDNFFSYINKSDIAILTFSFLNIKQIAKWNDALESYEKSSEDQFLCSKENRDSFRRWIRGYFTEPQKSSSSANFAAPLPFVFSPILTAQARDLDVFDHDPLYERFIKFSIIIATAGEKLHTLNLDTCPPRSIEKTALVNFRNRMNNSLNCVGVKCKNLQSIIFPITTRKSIAGKGNQDTVLVKTFDNHVKSKSWPKLTHIALAVPYAKAFDTTPMPEIIQLELDDSADDGFTIGLLTKIAMKFPNVNSLKVVKCDDDNLLKELAACTKLQHLELDNSKCDIAPNMDLSISEVISKCPIRSLSLIDVECTPTILQAKGLIKAYLEIGNLGWYLTPEIVSEFFATNVSLQEFHAGLLVCDHLIEVLLNFVTGNNNLTRLRVPFGSSDSPLSLEKLKTFIEKAAHIRFVTIDLKNYGGLPEEFVIQTNRLYPKVKLLLP